MYQQLEYYNNSLLFCKMASILSYFLLAQTCFNLPVVKVSDPDKENRPNCQGLLAKIASNGLDKNVLFFHFHPRQK